MLQKYDPSGRRKVLKSMLSAFDMFTIKVTREDGGKNVCGVIKCNCCVMYNSFKNTNDTSDAALRDFMAMLQSLVFHHVGIEWMLLTKIHQKDRTYLDLFGPWVSSGLSYCKKMCRKPHGKTIGVILSISM